MAQFNFHTQVTQQMNFCHAFYSLLTRAALLTFIFIVTPTALAANFGDCTVQGCTYFHFQNSQIFCPLIDPSVAKINAQRPWSIQMQVRLINFYQSDYRYLIAKPGSSFFTASNKDTNFEFAIRITPDNMLQVLMGGASPTEFATAAASNVDVVGSARFVRLNSTATWVDNNWHSLLLTYDPASTMTLYWDAIQTAQLSTFPSAGTLLPLSGGQSLFLGSAANSADYPGRFFDGDMMDVRLWNYSLNSVDRVMYAGWSATRYLNQNMGLAAAWLLVEGSGTVISDHSGRNTGYASGATWQSEDHVLPFIISVRPLTLPGNYSIGAQITLAVLFSEPVFVGGVPQLFLQAFPISSTNGTVTAFYSSGNTTSVLTFVYRPAVLDYTPSLVVSSLFTNLSVFAPSSWIRDWAGNDLVPTLPPFGPLNTLGFNCTVAIGCYNCTVPDYTSVLTCARSVFAGVTLNCTLEPKRYNGAALVDDIQLVIITVMSCLVDFSGFGGSTRTVNGTFSLLQPFIGTMFFFNFTSTPQSSGAIEIWDGVSRLPQLVNIYQPVLNAVRCGSIATITMLARRTGRATLLTVPTGFALADQSSGGWFGPVDSLALLVGVFRVNFTAGVFTGMSTLTELKTHARLVVSIYQIPDSTSSMQCPLLVIANLTSIVCIVTPRYLSQSIWALAINYSPRDLILNGTFGAMSSVYNTAFTVVYTPPPASLGGLTQLSDGYSTSVAVQVALVPDASSLIICDPVVAPGQPFSCIITPRVLGNNVWSLSTYFTPSVCKSAIIHGLLTTLLGNAAPSILTGLAPSGFAAQFRFTAKTEETIASGVVAASNGVSAPYKINVILPSDSTSSLICPYEGVEIGTSATCFAIPRKSGVTLYTNSAFFALQDRYSFGAFSSPLPLFGNNFSTTFTGFQISGLGNAALGIVPPFLPQDMPVWTRPDTTSTFTCPNITRAGVPLQCTVVPMQNGVVIFTLARFLQLNFGAGTSGIMTPLKPDYGTSFIFNFTATVTGPFTVSMSPSTTLAHIQVWDVPDNTTVVSCPTTALTMTSISCSITPMLRSQPCWSLGSGFVLSDSVGSATTVFSAVSPANFGASFTFFYTTQLQTALVSVSVGGAFVVAPIQIYTVSDVNSFVTCPVTVQLGASVVCGYTSRIQNRVAHIFASSLVFSFTGAGGQISNLAPVFGSIFSFNFTASMETGPVTIGMGMGTSATIQIWAVPDSTSTETCYL